MTRNGTKGGALGLSVATVAIGLTAGAAVLLFSCTDGSSSSSDATDAQADAQCVVTFGDATVDICQDASFDAFVPGTSGGVQSEIVYLRITDISGTCTGKATSVNNCTLNPTDYTATLTFEQPAAAGPPAGFVLYDDASVAQGPFSGSIAAFVKKVQPDVDGTKTCNMIESPCTDFQGTDEVDPFLLQARKVGGTGALSTIEFSVGTLHEPATCDAQVFTAAGDDPRVVFSPTPTVSALKGGPITLTGTQKFGLAPGPVAGEVSCTYTVTVRPSDGSGS